MYNITLSFFKDLRPLMSPHLAAEEMLWCWMSSMSRKRGERVIRMGEYGKYTLI